MTESVLWRIDSGAGWLAGKQRATDTYEMLIMIRMNT